jgi:hypothetical protein
MTENSTHAAPAAGPFRQYMTGFVVAALAAVVLSVTGALGTDEAPLTTRLGFWLICMLSGAFIGAGASTMFKSWGGLARWPWAEVLAISVLMALPQTLIVIAARSMIFDLRIPSHEGIGIMFGFVLFICVVMVALDYAMHKDGRAVVSPAVAIPAVIAAVESGAPLSDPTDRFRERLPHGLRAARLLALEAEDHYLRVHTDSGTGLILMRMADAVTELASLEGAQTHRSWWVARSAVVAARRSDGRATLTIEGEQEVPVSRSFYKTINEAGWLG